MQFHLIVYGFYLGIALVITWPLATILGTDYLGHPFGDTYEYVRHIWWFKHALQTGQPFIHQPLLGYPTGLDGAWLWAIPFQSFPAWIFALFLPLAAAFNVTLLLRLALNGWAMYILVRHLTGRRHGPALLAGVVFMAYPTFQGQLAAGHTGLLALWPVPLFIYAIMKLQDSIERDETPFRWLLLSAFLFTMSLWGSFTLLIYIVGPVTLLLLTQQISRRQWRGLRLTLAAVLLGGLLEIIFIGPFLLEQWRNPTLVTAGDPVAFSADLLTLVTPSFQNPIFAGLDYARQILGINPFERMGYVGIIVLPLLLVSLWRVRSARWWLLMAGFAWVFALGPLLKVFNDVATVNLGDFESFVTLPWAILGELPLLNMTRTPARFYFTVALSVAIMAGYGAAALWDRVQRYRWPLVSILMALIVLEYQAFWPLPTLQGTLPEPVRSLAERDDIRAVLNIPWSHPLAQKDGMFLQNGHQQPLIAGHIARRTSVNPALLTVLQRTFDPALLDQAQVDVIIWHKNWVPPDAQPPWSNPIYEDEAIALYEVPSTSDEPTFQVALDGDLTIDDDRHDHYFYAPAPGWLTLTGLLQANGRAVNLLLDHQPIHHWAGTETIGLNHSLPVLTAGYHTVSLALDPPCPDHYAAGLRCQSVRINDLNLTDFVPHTPITPIEFDGGLTLRQHQIVPHTDGLAVHIMWDFAAARTTTDIRFIHVLDENGDLIAQNDQTLGTQAAGGAWVEQVMILDLPAGNYSVYTGWYTYPDLTPFAVQADGSDAANHRVLLGQVTIGE